MQGAGPLPGFGAEPRSNFLGPDTASRCLPHSIQGFQEVHVLSVLGVDPPSAPGPPPRLYVDIYNPFISYVYIRVTPTPHTKTCISGQNVLPNPDLDGGTPHLEGSNFGSIFEQFFVQFWVNFVSNFGVGSIFGYIFGFNFGSNLSPFQD